MSKYASKIVDQAKAWLGKNEKDGSHKEIIDIYNGHKPLARGYKVNWKTDPWCAVFVSSVAIQLGYTDIIPTECSCSKMIELLKKIDSFVEDESVVPSPGWILFYDWGDNGKGDNKGAPDHVGIVEKVSGNTITVIEGNYSDSVKRRTIGVNGKTIRGYGVPKYDAEPVVEEKSIDALAREVIDGKHGNGAERKASLGDQYDAVQKRVNEILSGKTAAPVKSIDELAREVIAGKHGNGDARRKSLGDQYDAVQKRVNELLR